MISRDSSDNNITYITDLSKNGTFINNEQIGRNKTVILQNNDFIAIGEKLVGKYYFLILKFLELYNNIVYINSC